MNVVAIAKEWTDVKAEWLAIGVYEDETIPAVLEGSALAALYGRLVASKEITGGLSELTPLHGATGFSADSVTILGLGPRSRFDANAAYLAGCALGKRLSGKKRRSLAVVLSTPSGRLLRSCVEGICVGTRSPGLRKGEPTREAFETVRIVVDPSASPDEFQVLSDEIQRGAIVGEAVNLARDLTNTPPAEKSPTTLAALAEQLGRAAGIAVEVWDESRIKSERFGGLLGVAAGSDQPPAFVVLNYAEGGSASTLSIVGKGVTFDSGGLSLKPSASMEDMKSDMTGAAVTLAAMLAIARLKWPVNVRGYLPITENMTGGRAMKLGDVLTMRNGKTVEVLNTDAEGRLILADALSYAVEGANAPVPDRIINLATLTGACMVALGTGIAGLFSNDDAFASDVAKAAESAGEPVWRLPLDDDLAASLKSAVADLKNVGGKWGGAILAAKFLQEFVGKVPWVHLDIAGPSWISAETSMRDEGGTGCFVRTLVALVESTMITIADKDGSRGLIET